MKIRQQLFLLVSGVVLPMVMLAGVLTYQFWNQQHVGYEQKYLERAQGLRLALDAELSATMRSLRTVGDGAEIPAAEASMVIQRRFRRSLENNPAWLSVGLTDAQGNVSIATSSPDATAVSAPQADFLKAVLSSNSAAVSNLILTEDGRHIVVIAAPVARSGVTIGIVYALIDHRHWLELLKRYPVSKRGTVTLMDGASVVIARTLDDAQWSGKPAPQAFRSRIASAPHGYFRTAGLDGAQFYAAFSRSETSPWVVSTGVPQGEVDDALYWHALGVFATAVAVICSALGVAWRFGRDIQGSLLGLLASANDLRDGRQPTSSRLPIEEAREVQAALIDAYERLGEREVALRLSLQREAAGRDLAESGNRAKDRFLAMMGHELRNPLNAIAASAKVLGVPPADAENVQELAEVIDRQTAHLAAMVNNLMDVAQLESDEISLRRKALNLSDTVANVLNRFTETGRCLHLHLVPAYAPAWIDGDEDRIELVISSLLDNACKYTPDGGSVHLAVASQSRSSVLTIRDTGAGLTPDVAERMFDVFSQGPQTIDRAKGGLGIGLTLAQKLIELHGGELTASSDGPGRGTTFTVTLPRIARPESRSTAAQPEARGALQVTIVEDMADSREVMELLLNTEGYQCDSAADGPSGVEKILAGPSDIALIDIGLPGFDGLEVARRVRASPRGKAVRLIALTGFGTEDDRERGFQAGFDDFLVKPVNLDELNAALRGETPQRDAG